MLRCFFLAFYSDLRTFCRTDKGVVDFNSLFPVSAALIALMNDDFLNQVTEHSGCQFIEVSIAFRHFQEAADVRAGILCVIELLLQSNNFLPQRMLFLLIIRREDFESLIRQFAGNIVLVKPLDNAVQLLDTPLFQLQFFFSEHGS